MGISLSGGASCPVHDTSRKREQVSTSILHDAPHRITASINAASFSLSRKSYMDLPPSLTGFERRNR